MCESEGAGAATKPKRARPGRPGECCHASLCDKGTHGVRKREQERSIERARKGGQAETQRTNGGTFDIQRRQNSFSYPNN